MHILERTRALRPWQYGAIVSGLAVAGLAVGGVALGAAGSSPSMQVLPSPTGVKYSQNVEVKAQNLPKGSGTITLTICGLNNAAGQKIASPGADDCGGQADLGSGLVKLQTWKDGSFDQQYTLPTSGQKFGKNQRFCDSTHYCTLVVADANPSAPAYYIATELQFTDQKPTAAPTTTAKAPTPTTKPPAKSGSGATTPPTTAAATPATEPPTTAAPAPTTTTTAPALSMSTGGGATAGPDGGRGSGSAAVAVHPPDGTGSPTIPPLPSLPSGSPANPVPPRVGDAVTQACAQVAQAIQQGGQDTSALTIACSTLVNGGGGAQLQALLQSPSLGCFELSSLTQGNAQLADTSAQLATALQPYSSQLGTALTPVFGLLP